MTRIGRTGISVYGDDLYYFRRMIDAAAVDVLQAAVARVRHVEYFHDHARIERMLFDGVPERRNGMLRPDVSRPGLGLELKRADASRYAA